MWWIHGARNRAEHAFAAEVDQLLARLPDAHRIVAYSRPGADDVPGRGFDAAGRITIETITAAGMPVDADYYICGPDGFMHDLSAGLVARGTPPEQVAMEAFGAARSDVHRRPGGRPARSACPAGRPGTGPGGDLQPLQPHGRWDPSYATCSSSPRRATCRSSFGCRNGVCHHCESGVVDGDVEYVIEPLERPEEGRVLVCCTEPAGEITLEL